MKREDRKLKIIHRNLVHNNNFTGEIDAILGVKPGTKPSLEISSETVLPSDLSNNEEDDKGTSPLLDSEEIGRKNDNNDHEGDTTLSMNFLITISSYFSI